MRHILQTIIVDQPIPGLTGINFTKCTTLADVLAALATNSGAPGPTGPIGPTGISVTNATITTVAGVSHLIITLSDGTTLDAGELPCCTPITPPAANQRCFAYGAGIWGSDNNKWLNNSAFTAEVPFPFFPASLTLIGGYIKRVGVPVGETSTVSSVEPLAEPLTLPTPASLILSGAAQLIDKFVGIGLGLYALDQLINSIPEFATYGITFHAGRSPYWAIDYNTTVVEDLGLVFRDWSNNGTRSTDYVLRVGAAGYGDAFIPPVTQAEAEDPTHANYDLANLSQSETLCVAL